MHGWADGGMDARGGGVIIDVKVLGELPTLHTINFIVSNSFLLLLVRHLLLLAWHLLLLALAKSSTDGVFAAGYCSLVSICL